MKRLAFVLALVLLLCGCTAAPAGTTAPAATVPETTVGPQLQPGYYVPVNEGADLEPFRAAFASGAEKVGLNAKFDLQVLRAAGVAVQVQAVPLQVFSNNSEPCSIAQVFRIYMYL